MTILGAPGFIGIGNGFLAPQSRLHLHQPGALPVFTQWTNGTTGNATANEGLGIGITAGGVVQIHQFENNSINFLTNAGPLHTLKFHIGHSAANLPRVGIGNNNRLTYLHLGGPLALTGTGYRTWMDVGSLFVSDNVVSPDNMYVGLRQYGNDIVDAIISWGNNPAISPVADRLRFVFTSFPGNGQASTFDGLELGRMIVQTVSPGVVEGYTGFGDFLTAGTEPQNTLEVNSPAPNPNTPGGSSGFRLTDLTSITPTIANPGPGILAVDVNGDVIYVPDQPGGFVGDCGLNQFPFATSKEFSLAGFNFVFTGNNNSNTQDNVGIGTGCVPGAKLDVLQNSLQANAIGIRSIIPFVGTAGQPNTAGWFEAVTGATFNEYSLFTPPNSGVWSVGYALGTFIGSLSTNPVLLKVNGNVDALAFQSVSDSRLKTYQTPVISSIEKIRLLNPVYFHYDTAGYPQFNFDSSRQIGLLAQNVDSVLPEVVSVDLSGFFHLDYSRMVPLLVQGIKDQQMLIDSLFAIVNSNARQTGDQNIQVITLESEVILYQNTPNPFNDETSIRYYIPENTASARILFYDETGRVIKEEMIENPGNGTITLKTSGLATGIYTYALEVSGKILQVRKMQKVK